MSLRSVPGNQLVLCYYWTHLKNSLHYRKLSGWNLHMLRIHIIGNCICLNSLLTLLGTILSRCTYMLGLSVYLEVLCDSNKNKVVDKPWKLVTCLRCNLNISSGLERFRVQIIKHKFFRMRYTDLNCFTFWCYLGLAFFIYSKYVSLTFI